MQDSPPASDRFCNILHKIRETLYTHNVSQNQSAYDSYDGIIRIRYMGRWQHHPLSLSCKLPRVIIGRILLNCKLKIFEFPLSGNGSAYTG